jgi:serine/threonine protein kinase
MLHFNPIKRPSAEELLSHPFLYPLNPSKQEKVKSCVIPEQEFQFESLNLNTEQLKDIAYEEILYHHFDEYKKIWNKRNKSEKNPYLEFLENENREYDDGEEEEFEGSEDSFCLGD